MESDIKTTDEKIKIKRIDKVAGIKRTTSSIEVYKDCIILEQNN